MKNSTSKKTLILSAFAVSMFLTGCNDNVIQCLSSPSASNTHSKAIVREGAKSGQSSITSCLIAAPTRSKPVTSRPAPRNNVRLGKAIVREG